MIVSKSPKHLKLGNDITSTTHELALMKGIRDHLNSAAMLVHRVAERRVPDGLNSRATGDEVMASLVKLKFWLSDLIEMGQGVDEEMTALSNRYDALEQELARLERAPKGVKSEKPAPSTIKG